MILSKTTLFSTLTAVAISILSIHSASADSIVRAEKLSSSANRSYKVAGKRYTPMTKVSNFSQTGNAHGTAANSTAVKLPVASVTT